MSREKRNILFVVLFMCDLLTLFAERLPWDDQIIYFVMIDRFGTASINDVQTPDGSKPVWKTQSTMAVT